MVDRSSRKSSVQQGIEREVRGASAVIQQGLGAWDRAGSRCSSTPHARVIAGPMPTL